MVWKGISLTVVDSNNGHGGIAAIYVCHDHDEGVDTAICVHDNPAR